MDTSIYLYCSGSHWAGEKEPGRYPLGRPFQVQMPPGSTGKVVTVWCFPLVDHRAAYCDGDAAQSTNKTHGQGALKQVSGRGDTHWILTGRSDAAGASLTPGLAPWCNRHPLGAEQVEHFLIQTPELSLPSCPPQRCDGPVLVVGFGGKKKDVPPSRSAFSTQWIPHRKVLAFNLRESLF